ncbi:MAG: polysulfide reductase, partial [Candidatus Dormibacteria bacterium]
AGASGALLGAGVATYTAVLLGDTATPSWHAAHRQLPFVFAGSAAAAASGLGMLATPVAETGPARRLAVGGVAVELVAGRRMESEMGMTAEPLHQGVAGKLMRVSRALSIAGALATLPAARGRLPAVLSGAALMGGSVCLRFAIFEAGQASARDPRYTVVPQKRRLEEAPVRARELGASP